MAITQEQFDALVEKLEIFSKTHPRSYRLRVALFAMLGYAYIFLVLTGLLALTGLAIAFIVSSRRIDAFIVKFSIFLLIPAWAIVRSLWVTFPRPEGLKLSRHQVPQLFALVDELTAKLQTPQFQNIILNQKFNAGVIQIPRLGIFGWQENYLLLGLPLMQSLSLEQFKSVLAHELGHLSGNHARFEAWIYRMRKTWMQIYERLHQNDQHETSGLIGGSSVLFNSFSKWYWPSFNAYSFILARMNEYEADRCSVQLTGAKNTAEALINVAVKARFLENSFWLEIEKQVEHQADPPNNVYSSMLTVLHSPIAEEQTKQWLEQALAEKTNYADTHPCLDDRLKLLGYSAAQSQMLSRSVTIQTSAAEHLLGNALRQFTKHFDQDWQATAAIPWRQRYAYLQEAKGKLQALEQKAQMQTLPEQEAWERACYTLELQGSEAALPFLQDVLKIQPNHAQANYTIGRFLLHKADALGIAYIEKAMAQRIDWVIDGCELVYSFLWRQGQTREAQRYRERAEKHYQILLKARQERASVSDYDRFKSHTLRTSEVNELKQQLASYQQIKEAYLAEKIVTHFPEEHFYILGIFRKRDFFEGTDAAQKLINLLITDLQLPTQTYIIILNESSSIKLSKSICQTEQSLIFRR